MTEFTKDPSTHPAHGPLTEERLIRVREWFRSALAYSDGSNRDYMMADAAKAIDELMALRSAPIVPDRWVAVPVEPTEDMIIHGFESEPDESFSEEKDWLAYEAMSGCQQAAHRAKLCWAAMIAAAPQQE